MFLTIFFVCHLVFPLSVSLLTYPDFLLFFACKRKYERQRKNQSPSLSLVSRNTQAVNVYSLPPHLPHPPSSPICFFFPPFPPLTSPSSSHVRWSLSHPFLSLSLPPVVLSSLPPSLRTSSMLLTILLPSSTPHLTWPFPPLHDPSLPLPTRHGTVLHDRRLGFQVPRVGSPGVITWTYSARIPITVFFVFWCCCYVGIKLYFTFSCIFSFLVSYLCYSSSYFLFLSFFPRLKIVRREMVKVILRSCQVL